MQDFNPGSLTPEIQKASSTSTLHCFSNHKASPLTCHSSSTHINMSFAMISTRTLDAVVDRIMISQRCPHPNSQNLWIYHFAVLQSLSPVWLFVIPWTAAHQAPLSFTISWSLLRLMSIESVMSSYHLTLCHPLFLLPSILLSIKVFFSGSVLHIRWPKELQLHITPSSEHSNELISFRIDWFDLLVVQTTLKSFLQHHDSKESIVQCSAFFMVQLFLHLYMTTGKTIALTFVSNMMPLFFDKLSRFVIAFLPRSNVTWPRGIKEEGEIKVTNQLILKLGEGSYPGLSRWVHCNHRDP